jgi:hypothetical protein
MTVADILAKNGITLESTEPGRYYTTCPQCSATRSKEHQKSKVLGVTIENNGSIRFGCNHCNFTGPQKGDGDGCKNFEVTYDYHDADGNFLFQKVRNPPGAKNRFICRRLEGGKWVWNLSGIKIKPLYRLPEIFAAIEAGRAIAVAEGEKDCDNLWRIGLPATCNFDGTTDVIKQPKAKQKWRAEYSGMLRGADVVVLNDHDPPGYAHAEHAARMLVGVAKRVRRLDLAPHWLNIPKGADISDWLDAGHTREELETLIAAAPDYVPSEEAQERRDEKPDEPNAADAEIERLVKLSPFEYEQQRKGVAERLGLRASILDKLVQAERAKLGFNDEGKQGHAISFPEPEPWPEPIDGAALLNALAAAVRKHVVMSTASSHAVALWVLHSWLIDCFVVSPRLCVRSATKGSGKTTLLDALGRVVPRSLRTLNVTPAAVFRMIETYRPTLSIDEADTFLYDSDDLRGILDGNRKGDTVIRTVGDDFEPRAFATFCACAISLIGSLPDTLHDRSIVVDLRRRLRQEKITAFRLDRAGHLEVLACMAARWAQDNAKRVAESDPPMPEGIINREADNWRPLVAIAAVAAGRWPKRISKAMIKAHAAVVAGDETSRLEMLLGDIRNIFREQDNVEISSADLVKALVAIEGRPWAELGKARKPLTQNRLARMLKPLSIAPQHIGQDRTRGYVFDHFLDAFARYLAPEGGAQPFNRSQCDEMGTSDISQPFTAMDGRTVGKCEKPNNDGLVNSWTVAKGETSDSRAKQRAEAPRFRVVGPAPEGAACLQCHSAEGEVLKIKDAREIGSKTETLHRTCAESWFQGDEPDLSWRDLDALANAHIERADAIRDGLNIDKASFAKLNAELRQKLADMGLRPEHIELEFERVMAVVFGDLKKSH